MRHDAIPLEHLGLLSSLQSLTSLVVRHTGLPYMYQLHWLAGEQLPHVEHWWLILRCGQ